MRISSSLLLGTLAAGVSADKNYLGFNSGSTLQDRSAKFQKDFEAEFTTAQALKGAPGNFNAVRLYTNIQAYSDNDPIEAFQAAINTKTYILLGVWASGVDNIDNELTALQKAVTQFGNAFTDLVIGISIGSEDLYRVSATGIANKAGIGSSPDTIVRFIQDYKKAFANTPLANTPVGHVDTWDVWPNSTNKPVLDAIDWVGVDEYPYYENGKGNTIENSGTLFDNAFDATVAAANGKPVWVTETGYPHSGPTWDQAVCSVENAKYYWDEVGCRKLFGKVPTFWYNLRDSNPDNKQKFAITENLSTTPLFNLTCPLTFDTPEKNNGKPTGSGKDNGGGNGNGNGNGNGPTGTSDGSSDPTSTGSAGDDEGAASALGLPAATYACLALAAGVFALM